MESRYQPTSWSNLAEVARRQSRIRFYGCMAVFTLNVMLWLSIASQSHLSLAVQLPTGLILATSASVFLWRAIDEWLSNANARKQSEW